MNNLPVVRSPWRIVILLLGFTFLKQRIGELMPERRFYEARRQQMMEPSIRWNGIHDWYAVMGEKTGADRYAFRLYVQSGVRWIWGGGLLMIAGALLSGWRGRKRDE